jgi:hypothetical protein
LALVTVEIVQKPKRKQQEKIEEEKKRFTGNCPTIPTQGTRTAEAEDKNGRPRPPVWIEIPISA